MDSEILLFVYQRKSWPRCIGGLFIVLLKLCFEAKLSGYSDPQNTRRYFTSYMLMYTLNIYADIYIMHTPNVYAYIYVMYTWNIMQCIC